MKLTLGPVLFNWPAAAWRDFYFRIADEAPVDTVIVGEVVCSKREPFREDVMPVAIERLRGAGKEVLLGSLTLVTLERERLATADLAARADLMVEANDISCLAAMNGRAHAVGPLVQVYNEATASYLAGRGATRICLSPELPAASIAIIAASVPDVVTEVFAFGRAPLAVSVRCYHAREAGLSKDNCRFVCEKDADGLSVRTLDGESFVAINGIQTLSHTWVNLIGAAAELEALQVGSLRLSPQTCDMVAVAGTFRAVLDGRLDPEAAMPALGSIARDATFSNGFLHGRPGAEWVVGRLRDATP